MLSTQQTTVTIVWRTHDHSAGLRHPSVSEHLTATEVGESVEPVLQAPSFQTVRIFTENFLH
jgi:hypothetical protein